MSAGEHNIAISMRLYQIIQSLYVRINKAGIKVEKLTATEHLVTVQLRYSDQLQQVFPDAALRTRNDKSFNEYYYDTDCRLVWEASSNEH